MTCLRCIALDPRDRVGVEKKQSHGMGKGGEQIESTKRHVPTRDSQVAFRGCGVGVRGAMNPHETPRLLSEGMGMGVRGAMHPHETPRLLSEGVGLGYMAPCAHMRLPGCFQRVWVRGYVRGSRGERCLNKQWLSCTPLPFFGHASKPMGS